MKHERMPQSEYLLTLGKRLLEPYTRLRRARAAMITGSAAEGISDYFSDLDMTVYYEGELPSEEELAHIRIADGAAEREMPDMDVSAVMKKLGQRRQPWQYQAME